MKKFRTTSARFILERETRKKRQKKNAHYDLSAKVFSKKALIEDTAGLPFYMAIRAIRRSSRLHAGQR